jgi:tetratricopeptide (TPR) repeat protein
MEHAENERWREAVQHLLHVSRPEQAEQLARRRLAQHPQEAAAYEMLGLTLLNQKWRAQEALNAIEQGLALDPQSSDSYYFQSIVLQRLDRPSAALVAISEALRLDSFNATYLGYKAVLLNAYKQAEAALETATHGLYLDPGHVECLYQRVRALKQLGRFELALVTLHQLVRWHPNLAVAHVQLGEEALRKQELKAAEGHFREAARLDPTNKHTQRELLPVLAQLGQEAQRQQNYPEARRYFLELWQLDTGNVDARQGLEQLAKERFWLKRQFLRLDAWWATLEQDMKKGKPRAFLQVYLVVLPLIAFCCFPLLVAIPIAAAQWRIHPDVRLLRQQTSRWAAVGEVALMGVVATVALGLIVWLRLWLDTVSGEVILLLLVLLAAVVGICVWRELHKTSPSK